MAETVQADVHKDELVKSVTATIARHTETSDACQEETKFRENGVVDYVNINLCMEVIMARSLAERTTEEQLRSQTTFSPVQHEWKCTRCGGLMVNDFCLDVLTSTGEPKCDAKRCVQCGEIVDAVILQNRGARQKPTVVQPAWRMEPNHCVTSNR